MHGVAFSAARCAKVGAAFTATERFTRLLDAVIEFAGGIVLRISAANFYFVLGFIREADKVFNHIQQTYRMKQPLNH